MYAIIETGGKQFRVAEGDVLNIERLPVDTSTDVAFDRVLAVGEGAELKVGTPTVEGARVMGHVLAHPRGPKVTVFKYKPKANYRRKTGHRQAHTQVRIDRIEG